MTTIGGSTMEDITALRARIDVECKAAPTVEAAAQRFVTLIADRFPTIALARLFLVLPFEELPQADRSYATKMAEGITDRRAVDKKTPVLSLVGTRGIEPAWNTRTRSANHLAIPLIDKEFVQSAPMIAQLLAHLEVEFARFDDGRPIATRQLLGGKNQRFYVQDAARTRDAQGRPVIASQEFVSEYKIKTVFGMGGAYYDGKLAAAVLFSQETLDVSVVDRFPSLISNFDGDEPSRHGESALRRGPLSHSWNTCRMVYSDTASAPAPSRVVTRATTSGEVDRLA